jgi:hypothetical protein
MMRVRVSVVWACLLGVASAAPPGGAGIKWTVTAADPNNNVTAVRLAGTPYQMGWWYGNLLAPQVRSNIDKTIGWSGMSEIELQALLDLDLWPRMAPYIPQDFLDEMQGLVDGAAEAVPPVSPAITLTDLRRIIVLTELIGLECTSVVAVGSATHDGRLIQIRALDSELGTGCQDDPVITVYCPTSGPAYCNVGFAGLIGSLAGMNGEGIAMSEVGLHTPNVNPYDPNTHGVYEGIPMSLLMKKVLAQAQAGGGQSALDEAVQIIQAGPRTTDYSYGVGDAAIRDGRSLITSQAVCRVWGTNTAVTIHNPTDPNTKWLWDPNIIPDPFSGCDDHLPALLDVTYLPNDTNKLLDLMQPGGPNYVGPLDPNKAIFVARRVAMNSNLMDVVFDGQDLKLWVAYAHGARAASRYGFVEFDFGVFAQMYSLTVGCVPADSGQITVDPNLSRYPVGTPVAIGAVANAGWRFANWTGDIPSAQDANDPNLMVVMDSDRVIAAVFEAIRYSLTLTTLSAGGQLLTDPNLVVVEPNQAQYDANAVVKLTAHPPASGLFLGWGGDLPTGADANDPNLTLVMDADKHITARFQGFYTLTLVNGSINPADPNMNTGLFAAGDVVPITATVPSGKRFGQWTGDAASLANVGDPNQASTTVTMNGNTTLTATFVDQYRLTVNGGTGSGNYDYGAVANIAATVPDGKRFDRWTGDVATIANVNTAQTTITMNGAKTVTAALIDQFQLKVNGGTGSGTYDLGAQATISAITPAGKRFTKWVGDVGNVTDPNAASTTITMNAAATVTATFVNQCTLTVNGGVGSGVYDYDQTVPIMATTPPGSRFAQWTGDIANVGNPYAVSTTITLFGNAVLTATFAPQYTLQVVHGSGSGQYDPNAVVTISAIVPAGTRFVKWTGSVGSVADPNLPTTTITMLGDATVTASFTEQYTLVVTNGTGSGTYDPGKVVTIAATVPAGQRFTRWTGDLANVTDPNAPVTTITMRSSAGVAANFADQYTLVVNNGTGSGTYDAGRIVPITAAGLTGYRFDRWTGDTANVQDPNQAATFVTMNASATVTATFLEQCTLTVNNGTGSGAYDRGATASISATVPTGSRFGQWTGNTANVAAPSQPNTTVTMNANATVTATFVRQYTLTVNDGTGSGTFDAGAAVPIGATVPAGQLFDRWIGDISNVDNPNEPNATVTMNGDTSVRARFRTETPPEPEKPPVISDIPDRTIPVGQPYTETPSLRQGTPPVAWSLVSWPPGMTVDPNAGVVTWQNPTTSGSPFVIQLRASKQGVGTDDAWWKLTVYDPNEQEPNPQPPMICLGGGASAVMAILFAGAALIRSGQRRGQKGIGYRV